MHCVDHQFWLILHDPVAALAREQMTVEITPPALAEASRSNARIPNCCRRNAQANPMMPVPITAALRMSATACNFIKWVGLRVSQQGARINDGFAQQFFFKAGRAIASRFRVEVCGERK